MRAAPVQRSRQSVFIPFTRLGDTVEQLQCPPPPREVLGSHLRASGLQGNRLPAAPTNGRWCTTRPSPSAQASGPAPPNKGPHQTYGCRHVPRSRLTATEPIAARSDSHHCGTPSGSIALAARAVWNPRRFSAAVRRGLRARAEAEPARYLRSCQVTLAACLGCNTYRTKRRVNAQFRYGRSKS